MFPQIMGAVPAEITTLLADADTVWDGVKAFVIGVTVFYILFRIAKRVRGK